MLELSSRYARVAIDTILNPRIIFSIQLKYIAVAVARKLYTRSTSYEVIEMT